MACVLSTCVARRRLYLIRCWNTEQDIDYDHTVHQNVTIEPASFEAVLSGLFVCNPIEVGTVSSGRARQVSCTKLLAFQTHYVASTLLRRTRKHPAAGGGSKHGP